MKRMVNGRSWDRLGVMLDVVYNHLGNEEIICACSPVLHRRAQKRRGARPSTMTPPEVKACVIRDRERDRTGSANTTWTAAARPVQTIHDDSPPTILADIQSGVQGLARELGRTVCVIASLNENDAKWYARKPRRLRIGRNVE